MEMDLRAFLQIIKNKNFNMERFALMNVAEKYGNKIFPGYQENWHNLHKNKGSHAAVIENM